MNRMALTAMFFFSAAAFFVSPPPQYAAEAPCGAFDGSKCWQDESCFNVLFYKQCTTKFKYYPAPNRDPLEEEEI